MRLGGWCLLLLAGCQATPVELPVDESAPAAACQWSLDGEPRERVMTRAVTALEADGFRAEILDAPLGLVGAERSRRILYHDHGVERLPFLGGVLSGGSDGHVAAGLTLWFGGGSDEATRVERVSVAVGQDAVQVTRDERIIDGRGSLRQARTASEATFCRSLREAMDALVAGRKP